MVQKKGSVKGSKRVAGEKSLGLALKAKNKNLRAMKRELRVTITSVGNSYGRLTDSKRKAIIGIRVAEKKGDKKAIASYNKQINLINHRIEKIRKIQEVALRTARETGIKLFE